MINSTSSLNGEFYVPSSDRAVRLILAVTLATSLGLIAPAARSQTAETSMSSTGLLDQLQEVVVTAQRRPERLQDVPIAITAFDQDQLREIGVRRLDDLEYVTPGLNLNWSPSPETAWMNIRGIQEVSTVSSGDLSVGFYLDDVYYPTRAQTTMDLDDIERVEVLRGPQGTLFGRNTIGGAINITSNQPTDTPEADVMLGYGNYNREQLRAVVNGPIVPGELSGRLNVEYFKQDGWLTDSLTGQRDENLGNFSTRGQLRWQPSPGAVITFAADFSQLLHQDAEQFQVLVDNGPLRFLAPASLNIYDRSVATGPVPESDRSLGGSIRGFFDLGSVNLTSVSAYRKSDFANPDNVCSCNLSWLMSTDTEHESNWSQEFRLSSHAGSRFDWMTGLYFYHQDLSYSSLVSIGSDLANLVGIAPGYSNSLPDTATSSMSVFGHTHWQITDKLALTLGGRVNYDKKDFRTYQISTTPVLPPVPLTFSNESWTEFTPLGTLSYTPNRNFMIYGTASRGYKSGALNDTVTTSGIIPIKPEFLTNYEIGMKSTSLENRLIVNLAVYDMEWRDIQVSEFVPVNGLPTLVVQNIDKAHSRGAELEITGLITPWWELSANNSYDDARFGSESAVFDAGQRFLRTPLDRFNIASQFSFALSSDLKTRFRLNYAHQTETQLDFRTNTCCNFTANDLVYQGPYGLIDARLTLAEASDRWSVSLWGKNIGNTAYRMDASNALKSFVVGKRDFVRLGDPRMFGIEVRYQMK